MVEPAGTSNGVHPYHEMIQQFKEICAVSEDVAQMCIEDAEGNLQNAIVRFLNNGTSELDRQPVPMESVLRHRRREFGDESSQSSSASSDSSVPVIGVPVRRQPLYVADNSWFGWLRRLFSAPVYFFYYSVRQVFAFVFGLFGGFLPALTSPEEDVQTFKEEIDTKYNDVGIVLPWNHSTYAQALEQAKSSVRFLVVYLHNPSHQSTEDFVRNALYTEEFKDLLDRNRTLLWGANVKTREGHMVTQALKVITYPCVALICMRERSLACVARICGITELVPLIESLQQAMSANERFLNRVLNERAQREMDTRLRREQEEEYRRALEVDRKNVAERRRLESEKIESQMKEEEAQRQLEEKIKRFKEMRSKIKNEVSILPQPTAAIVRVSIRFPSGGSLERKFSENDSLELLFKTALSDDKCPEDFSLLSRFPNKTLNCAPDWYKEFGTVDDGNNPNQTFKEAGLVSSVVILVRDNQA